jgi:hypothetical protein
MTSNEFRKSLTVTAPPRGLALALTGLWWDAKGDWRRAHESAQQDEGIEGSIIGSKVIKATRHIATVGQASQSAASRSMRSGSQL